MLERIKKINNFLESGELNKAFDQALSLANVNGSFTKDLKTLKVRYNILHKKQDIGILV